MDIKIAFLLISAVVSIECQFSRDIVYPNFFSPYSHGVSHVNKEIPGKFHSTVGSENPVTAYNLNQQQFELDQSRPDENSQLSHRLEQKFGNSQPQKYSATTSSKGKPIKTETEVEPNIDRGQQYGTKGQNQEHTLSSKPNLNSPQFNPSGYKQNYNDPYYPGQTDRDNTNPGFKPNNNDRDYSQPGNHPAFNGQDFPFTGNYQSRPDPFSPFQSGQQSFGSNSQIRQPGHRKPIIQREEEEKFEDYKPITEFSWNLFKSVSNPQQPNFVISPLSPQHLLSYLAVGASGETKNEIVGAIRYKTPRQLNSLISTMLREPGNKELQLASALFVSDRISISTEFQRNLAENTKIIPTDFSKPEKFNQDYSRWVGEKTKGALRNVRITSDPSTRMIMSSAVYFKGEWIFKLNPGGIQDFYVNDNSPVQVPMMKLLKKLPYGKLKSGELGEWISLPYNSNDSMIIILPKEGLPLEELIKNLNVQDVFDSMNIDNYGNVTLTLPKFKVESTSQLVNPLQQMGIRQLFSTNAQLPNIFRSSEPLTVSTVLQQASLEVNEEGSIATSLTSVGVVALSFSPPTPDVVFNVNRPFVAMIIDRKNNFPYFIAKISNPSI